MEKKSPNTTTPSLSLAELLEFLIFHIILNWVNTIQKFFLSCQSILQSKPDSVFCKSEFWVEMENQNSELSSRQFCHEKEKDDGKLCRGDVEMVMAKLGIFCNPEGEKLQERMGLEELSVLFEEEEPSLEEVKEAFDVFDENRDGYIDARDLQRVLCSLGFWEGSDLEKCRKMIGAFDSNRDGRVEFSEFVKLMENSF